MTVDGSRHPSRPFIPLYFPEDRSLRYSVLEGVGIVEYPYIVGQLRPVGINIKQTPWHFLLCLNLAPLSIKPDTAISHSVVQLQCSVCNVCDIMSVPEVVCIAVVPFSAQTVGTEYNCSRNVRVPTVADIITGLKRVEIFVHVTHHISTSASFTSIDCFPPVWFKDRSIVVSGMSKGNSCAVVFSPLIDQKVGRNRLIVTRKTEANANASQTRFYYSELRTRSFSDGIAVKYTIGSTVKSNLSSKMWKLKLQAASFRNKGGRAEGKGGKKGKGDRCGVETHRGRKSSQLVGATHLKGETDTIVSSYCIFLLFKYGKLITRTKAKYNASCSGLPAQERRRWKSDGQGLSS